MKKEHKYRNTVGPFYRKGMAGNDVGFEVNEDGEGGLWLHTWNCTSSGSPNPTPPIHFSSEEQFLEFCTRLLGYDALGDWEELWRKYG